MIQRIEILNDWYFNLTYTEGMERDRKTEGFLPVQLPHSLVELPFNYFDEKTYQIIACYKRFFRTPAVHPDQTVKLRFEGVMAAARVFLNGIELGEHKGGYTPFEFEIQSVLIQGDDNDLTVVVDARERDDIPPFGGQIDYLTYGGIYREVSLDIYEPAYIRNARITTTGVLSGSMGLSLDLWLENRKAESDASVDVTLLDGSGEAIFQTHQPVRLTRGSSTAMLCIDDLSTSAGLIRLWTLDDPALYTARLTLQTGLTSDTFETRIGFRSAEFKPEGFFLNGQKIQIRGLNRHQSWPYVGYAMPKRAQFKDADILKNELNLNLVRTSHYPQSIHFLNRCDEIGLLVFEEIPGWQYIGNEAWKKVACDHVREMIERDWNHPSIIIWGVRINESADDHDFYTATNTIARTLDSSRAIGGVRCIENSELLEDVYTMNDFSNDGGDVILRKPQAVTGLDYPVPYMVTEYNGHMFPCKKFDCEERQMENTIRHLQIQNAAYSDPGISGAIGWCAFDYNTHKDFGSGDRVCYHGVMDMFRIKKFAAYAYQSQISPHIEPVLMPVTFWARGERSIGGVLPLLILTNCETLTIQFGQYEPIPVFKKSDRFGSLPYPPFVIDLDIISPSQLGEWGMKWEDGIIAGYVGKQKVAEISLSREPIPTKLEVLVDDYTLDGGQKDVTRIQVYLLDQKGNPLPFANPVIHASIQGPGRIQGPSTFALTGGSTGFYVESNGNPGLLEITVACEGLAINRQTIEVI